MSIVSRLRTRLRLLVHRREMERRADEEFRAHIEMETEDLIRRGVSPEEARRIAMRDFGGVTQMRETWRATRPLAWLDGTLRGAALAGRDVRLAARRFAKSPLFSVTVVATLALAIGLNSAVFSAIDALILRPLPGVRAPDELVQLYRSWPGDVVYGSNSIPHYNDLRDRSGDTFSGVSIWTFTTVNLATGGTPQRVNAAVVSANYFDVLGAMPARGRFFVAAEDTGRLAHPVAVVSHNAWSTIFGADQNIIGRTVVLNGRQYEVIGVTQPEFAGTVSVVTPTLWVPLTQLTQIQPGSEALWDGRGYNSFSAFARVKPGVAIESVPERMNALLAELRADLPDAYERSGITVVPQSEAGIHPMFRGAQVGLSAAVMAVVIVLLLVACVNVANLFLARARDRAREMAIRISIGASRGALIRQLLTESLLFAAVSGLAGLAVAQWAIGLANRITLPFDVDFHPGLSLSPGVVVFAVVVSAATAVLFGLAPALVATRPSLVPSLKGEPPAGESRSLLRNGLVIAQMALSTILLVCAGLFLRNLDTAMRVDKGFNGDNVLVAEMDPGMQGIAEPRVEEFYRTLSERLATRPGVEAVAFTRRLPLGLAGSDTDVEIPGYVPAQDENMSIQHSPVGEGYFDAMGIPIVRGRPILARDDSLSQPVLVVNQRFADAYFAGRDALGATVRTSGREHTIIGIVPTGKYQRLGEPPTPYMYFAIGQRYVSGRIAVVRTTGDPQAFVPTLRAEVAALDPTLPVSGITTMAGHLGIALLPARVTGAALGVFGLIGLLLAAIGAYGVVAHSVARRTREIGIRMAIGATTTNVLRLVMRQGLATVSIGVAIGFAGAWAGSRALGSVLYAGGENDIVTFLAVPVVLVLTAMLACWIPARQVTKVDPTVAMRQE